MVGQSKVINVVFCFDENLVIPFCVTLYSLLSSNSKPYLHYKVFVVYTGGGYEAVEKRCSSVVAAADEESELLFIAAEKCYADAFETHGITATAYQRLAIHRFIDEEMVIYSDVDILFKGDLEMPWVSMQNNHSDWLVAGVKGMVNVDKTWNIDRKRPYWSELEDTKGDYINSGLLVMNLDAIRKSGIETKWDAMVSDGKYYYLDQDIINITCKGKISFLNLEYNYPAEISRYHLQDLINQHIYSAEEVERAYKNPIVNHYSGGKPWNSELLDWTNSDWWRYVYRQKFLRDLYREEVNKRKRRLQRAKAYNVGDTLYQKVFGTIRRCVLKELPLVERIECHICDHCNLNCSGCTHFSNIAPEHFKKVEEFEREMSCLSAKIRVNELKLLGGEPLLHPQLVQFLQIARKYFPWTDITLCTNCLLVDTMDDVFWDYMRNNRIRFVLSKYPPISEKFSHYLDVIASRGVEVAYIHTANEFWAMRNPKGDSDPKETYANCCEAYCRNLRNGRLYICPDACYMDYYNQYFDKNIPVDEGIDIYQHSGEEIRTYLSSYKETCRYCTNYTVHEWAQSSKAANEWNADIKI